MSRCRICHFTYQASCRALHHSFRKHTSVKVPSTSKRIKRLKWFNTIEMTSEIKALLWYKESRIKYKCDIKECGVDTYTYARIYMCKYTHTHTHARARTNAHAHASCNKYCHTRAQPHTLSVAPKCMCHMMYACLHWFVCVLSYIYVLLHLCSVTHKFDNVLSKYVILIWVLFNLCDTQTFHFW